MIPTFFHPLAPPYLHPIPSITTLTYHNILIFEKKKIALVSLYCQHLIWWTQLKILQPPSSSPINIPLPFHVHFTFHKIWIFEAMTFIDLLWLLNGHCWCEMVNAFFNSIVPPNQHPIPSPFTMTHHKMCPFDRSDDKEAASKSSIYHPLYHLSTLSFNCQYPNLSQNCNDPYCSAMAAARCWCEMVTVFLHPMVPRSLSPPF